MTATDRIVPLGDQAALIHLNSEEVAARFARAIRQQPPLWLVDVVQAYTSVAVFFDLDAVGYQHVAQYLGSDVARDHGPASNVSSRSHVIPCCYELQLDLARVAHH